MRQPWNLILQALLGLALTVVPASAGIVESPLPVFTKAFAPATIGPGSVSMLIFTIDNTSGTLPVGVMAFTDTLPGGVDLAAPAFVSNTCSGTVSAPDGGDTITLSGGQVAAGQICTIVVNVTAATPGEGPYTNTTGDLTSTGGNSGTAAAELTVDEDLPGFSKSFAPSTVEFGGRSTLTFTIDNTTECGECASDVEDLAFTDTLPVGMVVADPANASTDCQNLPFVPATLVAVPGTSFISLSVNGAAGFPALEGEGTCSVTVDVIGGAVGSLGNVSGDLLADSVSAGKAAAVLEVTGVEDLLALAKEFTDDPVPPGGTVTLEFTVTNKSRDFPAGLIQFTDDLDTTLSGLVATGLPASACNGGSVSSPDGGATLEFSGGSLPPEGSCTFAVELDVPAAAVPGTYPNTTSGFDGVIDGSTETGNVAGDLLFVVSFPVVTKTFTDDPVGAGGTVTLEFTITNPDATSTMSGITLVDELTDNSGFPGGGVGNGFLPSPVSIASPTLPTAACGGTLDLVSLGIIDREGLELTGGSLAANDGMAGGPDTCTFSVTLDIPAGLAAGTYLNTTEPPTAVLPGLPGSPTVTGKPASDDIVVVAAPRLSKEFTDDPAAPGGTVTLVFTLENVDPDNAASAIAFSDDLGATLAGLTLTSVMGNTCGGTVTGGGTGVFGYSGGTLAADASCTITLELTVPGMVGGTFENTTSEVTATVATLTAKSSAASDNLVVAGLLLSKEFTDDPVIAGGTATLRFTLDNVGASDATGIAFADDLDAVLTGLAAIAPPATPCGGALTGTSLLAFTGGSVLAGASCTFDVTVSVPAGTIDDTYLNVTSGVSSSLGTGPPAVDFLIVDSNLLALSKAFTNDPVNPGGTVTLEFTLTNLDPVNAASAINFSDNLGDAGGALLGLEAQSPALLNTCGGMAALPATSFSYSGGSLAGGATCTIRLSLTVPGAPLAGSVFPNTTSGVTGTITGLPVVGDPASDDLEVRLLTLGKTFDGPTTATGTAVLTFTITNLDASSAVSGLAFSDDLGAVIPGLTATLPPTPDPPCGAGSALTGTSFLAFTGGSLAAAGSPGGSCSFAVTVTVPAASAGSFPNTTSALFLDGIEVAGNATALLVIEPPPTFAKSFAPNPILAGATSTLSFTIDNTASALPASSLAFTDNLPAGLVVATPPNASTTCTGGTLTAVAGTGVITYTGGTVSAMASCTVSVDVTSSVDGMYVNTTGDLNSSSGNSGTASATLTVLEADPPTVTLVDSTPGTGDGELAECEEARVAINKLLVTFSEAVQNPAGDGGLDDVTNPANYLLVASGPDNDFSTVPAGRGMAPPCGPAAGDDVEVPIVGVTYDGGTRTATLSLGAPLGDSLYRLLVCGSTTIRDLAGNPLDGDGDGVGGDDFARTYRVELTNLLDNGHFDCTIDSWTPVSTVPEEIEYSPEDVDASSVSGSAGFTNLSASQDFSLGQCSRALPGSDCAFEARVRVDAAPDVVLTAASVCEFFPLADCAGASLGLDVGLAVLEDTGGLWEPVALSSQVQGAAVSALCSVDLRTATGGDFDAFLDDARLICLGAIFTDGFESGDTSAWSATVP